MGPIANRRSHGRRRTAIIISEFMGPVAAARIRVPAHLLKGPMKSIGCTFIRAASFNQRNNCARLTIS